MTREELLAQADVLFWACADNVTKGAIHDHAQELRAQAEAMPSDTPAAKWRQGGQQDPHGNQYDCTRASLCMGYLTDDELANAVYLKPDIAHLTAAKDRIRWLSRRVEAMNNGAAQLGQRDSEPCHMDTKRFDVTQTGSAAAAPPSAAQPVACLCCGTQTSGVAIQHAECAEAVICASCVEVLRAAPDLAARVARLEGLLRETQQFGAFGVGSTLAERIRAALAEGEE